MQYGDKNRSRRNVYKWVERRKRLLKNVADDARSEHVLRLSSKSISVFGTTEESELMKLHTKLA